MTVAIMWGLTDDRAARRRDRHVDEYGDSELDEYNAMLQRIAHRDAQHDTTTRQDPRT